MKHGEVLDSIKCDMPCAGTSSGEYCGGWDKITAYEIKKPVNSKYVGCYADEPIRAMDAEGVHSTGDMTNEVRPCMAALRNAPPQKCIPCLLLFG